MDLRKNTQEIRNAYAAKSTNFTGGGPAVFVIEPTSHCNVNCIMCPNSLIKPESLGSMSIETLERIASKINPYAELVMLYFMGEPTLHPSFASYLRRARELLDGKIVVSTNCQLMSEEVRDALLTCTDVIITCIDRWKPTAYEKIRRGANYQVTVTAIEELLSQRVDSGGPMIIVKGLGIELPGDDLEALLEEKNDFISYWTERGGIPLVGWLDTWAGSLSNLTKISSEPTPYESRSRVPCADLWFKMVVNWRGEVVLCCHDWRSSTVVGSLVTETVEQVWNAPDLVTIRSHHLRGDFDPITLCRGCKEWAEIDELDAYITLSKSTLGLVF